LIFVFSNLARVQTQASDWPIQHNPLTSSKAIGRTEGFSTLQVLGAFQQPKYRCFSTTHIQQKLMLMYDKIPEKQNLLLDSVSTFAFLANLVQNNYTEALKRM
jgi:hypothetical protein